MPKSYPSRMTFDCVTVAFGLRNMTHKDVALAEMRRVLRPGGRLLVLEFPPNLEAAGTFLRLLFLPGHSACRQTGHQRFDSYRYLSESIRVHPGQEAEGDDGRVGL